MTNEALISADGVRRAANIVKGHAIRTPLIENEYLNEKIGGRIFLKAEMLQHCGSFKFRGAYNLISQISSNERQRGIIAWSSGNHAQGVARAAALFGVRAAIVMPEDTPEIKAFNVRRYGAEIIPYDRYKDDREEIAHQIQVERGMVLAPSYDHPLIMEGQGTLALEVAQDLREQNVELDDFVVCCGGGGLTAGCATILRDVSAQTNIWIAEPEGFAETKATLETGERHTADVKARTICDAIATPTPGRLTLPILQRTVKGGVAVSEDEVIEAIIFAYKHLKLVVEPGGAVGLAGVLSGKIKADNKVVAVTLSGGNIDPELFGKLLKA